MKINLLQLAVLASRLVESYAERGVDSVHLTDMDQYWIVESPEWMNFQEEPKLSVGSLQDDWSMLQRVLEG